MAATTATATDTASDQTVRIAFTTDVHGSFFPTNYTTLQPAPGSLARVKTALDSLRQITAEGNFLLLDNGDILQGQPTAYYYNYIDTTSNHLVSEIYNYMGYDATTIGNHDVETGHSVYDRWRAQNHMPMLGANVIDTSTGKPYLQPYAVFNRGGLKIAVLGLLTPAIPSWLPEVLWSGLRFDPMDETARKWIPIIQQTEQPDLIIGLFHSGHDETVTTGNVVENASMQVARDVPGFSAVLLGHDHQRFNQTVTNVDGQSVVLLNPANAARAIGLLEITPVQGGNPLVNAKLVDVTALTPDSAFLARFAPQQQQVRTFVERPIGEALAPLSARDAFFGPSAFMTLLHKLQLQISGADISFAAPLAFDAEIKQGPVKVADMFTLYKYENMLYTLRLTGREIKNYLEEAYDQWIQTVNANQPHIIKFAAENPGPTNNRLARPSYNFDSASGIDYTVNITKPRGERIEIQSLSNGKPFDPEASYLVAVNSYRANGGGNLLSNGAGIDHSELPGRIVRATDKDLRYYLIKEVEANPVITAEVDRNWRFVPADVARKAIETDSLILFSPNSSTEQK
ncbi:MAG: 5'-nucleotidase C-terminal domain-containing protein [Firmicutes bacterium]|nr:5'-nucleotidase C-terminal domain-containing protein [Bacillota bacterium]MCM1476876.1 5'-nucleotidase C-terminal domain-containing protein [Bacteroides sp.]